MHLFFKGVLNNQKGPVGVFPLARSIEECRGKKPNQSTTTTLRLCPILVDPKNIEAVAAAFILQALLRSLGELMCLVKGVFFDLWKVLGSLCLVRSCFLGFGEGSCWFGWKGLKGYTQYLNSFDSFASWIVTVVSQLVSQ